MESESGPRVEVQNPESFKPDVSMSMPNNTDIVASGSNSDQHGSQQPTVAQMYAQLMTQPGLMMMPFVFPGQPFPMFARMPAPTEMEENPTYVNAKQYKRILKRREARAKLEERRRIPTARKTFLHKSRHEHACRRQRGPGGRFLTKAELKNQFVEGQSEQSMQGIDSHMLNDNLQNNQAVGS